jgi:hypothetical protein
LHKPLFFRTIMKTSEANKRSFFLLAYWMRCDAIHGIPDE